MGRILRNLALILVFTPLAAMFSEPFFEAFFDSVGLDTENWAAPLLHWAYGVTEATFFWPISVGLMSFGVGVWAHFFATVFGSEVERRKMSSLIDDIYTTKKLLLEFIQNPQTERKIEIKDPKTPIETTAKVKSLMASISSFGVPTPELGMAIDEREARFVRDYLSAVYPFMASEQKAEGKKIAREFIASSKLQPPATQSQHDTTS